jgi:hypothetical protein
MDRHVVQMEDTKFIQVFSHKSRWIDTRKVHFKQSVRMMGGIICTRMELNHRILWKTVNDVHSVFVEFRGFLT